MAKKRDIYTMSNGQPVTEGSVSELCGVLDKPFLVPWAAKKAVEAVAGYWKPGQTYTEEYITLALQDSKNAHRKYKDTAADIGTRAHLIVGAYVEGQLLPEHIKDPSERRCLENFMRVTEGWKWLGSEITLINEWWECPECGVQMRSEYNGFPPPNGRACFLHCTQLQPLVLRGYGGTADGFAQLPNGMYILPDFKTSNFISPTYSMQCCLYADAKPVGDNAHLRGLWKMIQEARILHFDKELLTWEVLERNITEQRPYVQHFIGCRRWTKKFNSQSLSTFKDPSHKAQTVEVDNTSISVSSSQ